jgi:hypothetical protein
LIDGATECRDGATLAASRCCKDRQLGEITGSDVCDKTLSSVG